MDKLKGIWVKYENQAEYKELAEGQEVYLKGR